MNAVFTRLITRLDAMEAKERLLLTLAAVLLLVMVWFKLWFEPLQQQQRQLTARGASAQLRISEAELLTAQILEAAAADLNAPVRAQIAATDAEIATAHSAMQDAVGELIPPQEIAQILKRVLEQSGQLKFSSLEGLGVTPLRESSDDNAADESEVNAFRHGFRIQFQGSYLDALAYLEALEVLPWRLFWDAVDIEVGTHPQAEVSVTVYTLSLERSWIGV